MPNSQLNRIRITKIVQTSRRYSDPLEVTMQEEYLRPTKGWSKNGPSRIITMSRHDIQKRLKGGSTFYGKLPRRRWL